MRIVITNQSELPIYAQITEQLKEQILSGELSEGETLPSIRGLAKELGVSVITTTRAYAELEREGFIASIQGKGSVVLPKTNSLLREQYLKRIETGLETAISTARAIGMEKDELRGMLDILWTQDGQGRERDGL